MSWSVYSFVDAQDPMPQFIRDVESACHIRFTQVCSDAAEWYEYRDSLGVVCLRDMKIARYQLENDRGINFEDYPYELNVRPYRTADWERD